MAAASSLGTCVIWADRFSHLCGRAKIFNLPNLIHYERADIHLEHQLRLGGMIGAFICCSRAGGSLGQLLMTVKDDPQRPKAAVINLN
jgi:hypothetical protein